MQCVDACTIYRDYFTMRGDLRRELESGRQGCEEANSSNFPCRRRRANETQAGLVVHQWTANLKGM